jgi:uncharacterized protein
MKFILINELVMKRYIERVLQDWKKDASRMPIVLRGARQIGKSHVVREASKLLFESVVEINFEVENDLRDCFDKLDAHQIISQIELLKAQEIVLGKTLLFLDEIQACPRALMALRYFKEEMPELHVIAAGSLLEFSLSAEGFSMPVGRVLYLYMQPMTFNEFLLALGEKPLVDFINQCHLTSDIPLPIHQKLSQHIRDYIIIGGMPAVVEEFRQSKSYQKCQRLQNAIMTTYVDDFAKYANTSQHKYLQSVMNAAPGLVGQICKYSHINPSFRANDLSNAISNLSKAGVIYQVPSTKASGLPLSTLASTKKFKLIFLDIGLMTRASGLTEEVLTSEDFFALNRGALMEQLVGQELLAYQDSYQKRELFFWMREKTGSMAEIDYLFQSGRHILPVEVKAGKSGKFKSMLLFMREKESKLGIKVSLEPLGLEKNILSVPVYLLSRMKAIVDEALSEI